MEVVEPHYNILKVRYENNIIPFDRLVLTLTYTKRSFLNVLGNHINYHLKRGNCAVSTGVTIISGALLRTIRLKSILTTHFSCCTKSEYAKVILI